MFSKLCANICNCIECSPVLPLPRTMVLRRQKSKKLFVAVVVFVILVLFDSLVPVSSVLVTEEEVSMVSSTGSSISSSSRSSSRNSKSTLLLTKWKTNLQERERDAFWTTTPTDVKSPLHVAQCRATCLHKFNNRDYGKKQSPSSPCFQQPDCFTCWKSCEFLESSWNRKDKTIVSSGMSSISSSSTKPICSQPRICLSGCQAACNFYEILTRQSSEISVDPVVPTNNVNVLLISDGKIQWPRYPREADAIVGSDGHNLNSIVYLVVQQYSDHKWKQITQTALSEVDIPRGLNSQQSNKLRSTRVLVVSPAGLVTMYSPQLLSKDMKDGNLKQANFNLQPTSTSMIESTTMPTTFNNQSESPSAAIYNEWNLKKVSLIHQKFLVIAELSWNQLPGAKDYLITWELDGGGLKGHLVTDSTVVTLSLWPDTIYHIQVELCGEKEEEHSSLQQRSRKSFPLAVDTSEALFPMVQPSALSKTQSSHKSVTEFLNVTLLVTVSSFLFILLCLGLGALTWCRISRRSSTNRRRTRELRLLQDMEESDSNDTMAPISTKEITKNHSSGLTVAVISNQFIYSNNRCDPFLRIPPPTMWSSLFSPPKDQQQHQSNIFNTETNKRSIIGFNDFLGCQKVNSKSSIQSGFCNA